MQTSSNDWKSYIERMSAISKKAADEMQRWIDVHGLTDERALLEYAYALSSKYGEAIGALACQMYDATALAQGVTVAPAIPAPIPKPNEVASAIRASRLHSEFTIPPTVGKIVKQVGADTTLKNAQRDGAQFAWIPHGDTCAFCLMLASNGWRFISKKALRNGHAPHIHSNCDCQYAVRFDKKSTVEGYDPDALYKRYKSFNGDLNAIRRANYEQNKDKINEQKRLAYARLKESSNPSTL